MIDASTRVATTIAGDVIVFLILPLMVVAIIGMSRWAVGVSKTLGTQDKALALLVQDVRPQGEPTLRSLVQDLTVDVAVMKRQPGNHP